MAKEITQEIVNAVKKDIMAGQQHRPIAKQYGIGVATVSEIRNGKYDVIQKFNPADPMVRSDAMRSIRKKKKGFTLEFLADKLKTNLENAQKVIQHLSHHDGYNLVPKGNEWQLLDVVPPVERLELSRLLGKEYEFGIVSDTQLCNKHARLDVLEAAYDEFGRRKIHDVFHAGNIIDGEFRYNRYEICAHGAHDQSLYVADHYPQRADVTTYFVTGECHEGWYQTAEGIKIGWYIQKACEEQGRPDMKHLGHVEADVFIKQKYGDTNIRVMHPGGGSAYALSYPSQKMVESFQGGEKPHILILGHFHKFDVCYPREVTTIVAGCVEDQTSFMRKKKIAAHVGFIVCKIGMRIDGTIGRCNVEWYPFYDRKYHQKLNEYTPLSKAVL